MEEKTVTAVAPERSDSFETELLEAVSRYVRQADVGEASRLVSDRIGARLIYGHHWGVEMPPDRAAITANITLALILHKIAIQTKQDPIPVIEADEAGDQAAAQIMRSIIMRVWRDDDMKRKTRRGQLLCNATRTAAAHVLWDPSLRRGAGDITTEIIPGWNLIIDNRVSDPGLMQYAGHRATMTRARAMTLYPEHADRIRDLAEGAEQRTSGGPGVRGTIPPTGSPFVSAQRRGGTVALVNGQPVLTAFAGDTGTMPNPQDAVTIIELYHRDPRTHKAHELRRDDLGEPIQEVVRDEEGMPQFERVADRMHYVAELGMHVPVPGFSLALRKVYDTVLKPDYPDWRRTTWLDQGNVSGEMLLEDRAWDGPLPYAYFNDSLQLDGFITRGTMLQLHYLQGLLNVSLSVMTDNLRMGSIKAWLAGSQSGFATQALIPSVGQVVPVNDPSQIVPIESPPLDANWFQFLDRVMGLMERIVGIEGIMQGEATGRVDSAQGYDLLAEIGGSRVVESTQRMESTISEWAEIVGWFAQKYYTQKHSIAIENTDGNITWDRAFGPLIQGPFTYSIATGSTMAWSESAVRARLLQDMQMGLIDKVGVWQRLQYPDWKRIAARLSAQPPALSGPAGAPPPRTRQSVKQNQRKAPPQLQIPR